MNNKTVIFISSAVFLLLIIGVLITMTEKENPKVEIETSMGNIIIELYPEKAPITVDNFLSYVDEDFYDNTVFHRVINDFMIQGGGFLDNGEQKNTKSPIKLESNNGLKNDRGTIAMARTMVPDSATSQFFINIQDNEFLNYGFRDEGYAVFGKVIEGLEVIDKIKIVETQAKNGMPSDWPVEEIYIKSISRV